MLPCLDCRRDADDHQEAHYDSLNYSDQYVATPRAGPGGEQV